MLELRSIKKLTPRIKVNQYLGVRILYKESRKRSLLGHLSLAVNKLYKRKVIITSDIGIVLTECRCNMYNTGTVCHGNV